MEHFRRLHSEYRTALSMKNLCSFYGSQFVKRDAPYCYDPVLCINLHKIKVKKDAKLEQERDDDNRSISLDVDLSVITASSPVSSSPRNNERLDGVNSPRQDKHSRLQRIMTKRAEGGGTGGASGGGGGFGVPSEALSTCPPSTHHAPESASSGLGFLTSPRMNRTPVQRSFTSTPSSGSVIAMEESERGMEGRQGKKFEKSLTIGSKSPTRIATKISPGSLHGAIQFRSKPTNRSSRDDQGIAYVAKETASQTSKSVSKERRPLLRPVERQEKEPSRERETTPHVPDRERESREPERVRETVEVPEEGRQPRSPERRARVDGEKERERERRVRRPSISSPPAMDEERLQAHWAHRGRTDRETEDEGATEELAKRDATTSSKLTQSLSDVQSARTDNRSTGTRGRRERAEARGEKSDKEETIERPETNSNNKPERAVLSLSPTRVRFDEKEKEREPFVLASPRDDQSMRASSPRVRAPVQRNRTIGANKSPNNSNSYEINSKSFEKGSASNSEVSSFNSTTEDAVKPIDNFDSVHSSIEQLESYLLMQRTFKEEADCNDSTTVSTVSEPSPDSKDSPAPNPLSNDNANVDSNNNATDEALGQLLSQMNRNLTSAKKGTVRMDPVSPRRNMYRAEVDPSSLDKKFEKIVSFQTQIKSPRTLRNEREATLGLQQVSHSPAPSLSSSVDPTATPLASSVGGDAFGTSRRPNPWYDQLFASSEVAMKIPENVDVMAYLDEYYERHLKSKETSETQENAL